MGQTKKRQQAIKPKLFGQAYSHRRRKFESNNKFREFKWNKIIANGIQNS